MTNYFIYPPSMGITTQFSYCLDLDSFRICKIAAGFVLKSLIKVDICRDKVSLVHSPSTAMSIVDKNLVSESNLILLDSYRDNLLYFMNNAQFVNEKVHQIDILLSNGRGLKSVIQARNCIVEARRKEQFSDWLSLEEKVKGILSTSLMSIINRKFADEIINKNGSGSVCDYLRQIKK